MFSLPRWTFLACGLFAVWSAACLPAGETETFVWEQAEHADYWRRFGAQDPTADRFGREFGPAPVHCQNPEGRLDITAALVDQDFGADLFCPCHC
ncbi:MAG: hypothetical protein N3A66_06380 [Planctomycetota bacterium]|nr:hypothetical protein [Planctomycetota bacterium]